MALDPESTSQFTIAVLFTIVASIIGLGVVFIVVSTVRNVIKVRASGHDPMTLQSDLAVKLLDSV